MPCSCGCNPCSCNPAPVTCCTPTTESVEYTFENANLAGIGVFDNDTDNLVQFRGIVSDSASLTVTLNATDNTIVLDFDDAALVADIPDATTAQRGILETATNAEAIAKAAADKILTPSNLAALGASQTFVGLVELATDAETQAGLSSTLAVTPAGLASTLALHGTTTFADAASRGAAVAGFAGQFGGQLDVDTGWIAGSTAAGDWLQLFTLGKVNESTANTTLNMNGNVITLVGNGDLILSTTTLTVSGATSTFSGSTSFFGLAGGASQIVDFANTLFSIGNAPMNGETLIGADSSGFGTAVEYAIVDFLSTYNVQTGWGTPSGTLARTTFAAYNGQVITNPPTQAEVQAIDNALVIVSQRLAALITDLKAVLLPAT